MFVIPWGNHAQLGGGSVAERLTSTLAYGWVERCSDVVGCATTLSQDKYFLVFNLCNCICLINYYEHVECLNVNDMYFFPMFNELYICICISFQCIFFMIMFMGLDCPF